VNPRTGVGTVQVSIQPEDFSIPEVLCLVRVLKQQHHEWNNVLVLIFSSNDAALNYDASGMTRQSLQYKDALRGLYSLDPSSGRDDLQILPFGLSTPPWYSTTIPLENPQTSCRLMIADRCLLALEPLVYPQTALTSRAIGSVVLRGTIGPDGHTRSVTVESASSPQGTDAEIFAAAAVRNLESWWLEPTRDEDPVHVTYRYEIDPLLQKPGQVEVDFALPASVTVRARPE
jgi:hypothetical protein